jgi:preprotein translocase subunit SecA
MSIFSSLFKDENTKALDAVTPLVAAVNNLEDSFIALTDNDLKEKTQEFKNRYAQGESLDALLPEAFAAIREASRRTLGQRHFDVQIIGGIIIHKGSIAEMRTGEGKTLVATLPTYLNALTGKGVHVVTVNDYLARRDAAWMGQIYNALGLSVGVINSGNLSFLYDEHYRAPQNNQGDSSQSQSQLETDEDIDAERDESGFFKVADDFLRPSRRKEAYLADITYGTNSEFGFDYLRDNISYSVDKLNQRGHFFAIVDEIDSILIDEARTPLIISSPSVESEDLYATFAEIAKNMQEVEHYIVDEKKRQIQITEAGIDLVEKTLQIENLYAEGGMKLVHHLENAVTAQALYRRDQEYVIQQGKVVIVDESTGRLMPSRRWSNGIHQAVEAKEGVEIQRESRTFASVTYQNYFRMYEKLGGMTGTAKTSEEEFFKVYNLSVVQIPTNRPIQRKDHDDLIYQTRDGKFKAIARKIKELNEKGQPVLVGTVSVENNELLSRYLDKEGISHAMLNAKHHEEEGEITARAGRKGAVTIATNMAGRGVDIKLGGKDATQEGADEIKSLGGLFVLGTERHNARRIDNQLRGRAGRQGDPGETQFFVSLDDDLMRVFGGDSTKKLMGSLGLAEDEAIQNKMLTKALENAQTRIEGFYFDARKSTLSYDDVLNTQRRSIYNKRKEILMGTPEEVRSWIMQLNTTDQDVIARFDQKAEMFGRDAFIEDARRVMLQTIDLLWVDHLETMDYLRSSVGLRGYGQRDPLIEYKKEGIGLFRGLEQEMNERIISNISLLGEEAFEQTKKQLARIEATAEQAQRFDSLAVPALSSTPKTADGKPIGRNDRVRIQKDGEEQVLKMKKAEPFLSKGWILIGLEDAI